eukprot:COSAG04_NODE_347_length_16110_cov_62.362411_3_plen_174_part_00
MHQRRFGGEARTAEASALLALFRAGESGLRRRRRCGDKMFWRWRSAEFFRRKEPPAGCKEQGSGLTRPLHPARLRENNTPALATLVPPRARPRRMSSLVIGRCGGACCAESEPAAATEVAADARLLQSFSRQMLRDDQDLRVAQQCISDALEERHALLRHRHCLLSSGPAKAA